MELLFPRSFMKGIRANNSPDETRREEIVEELSQNKKPLGPIAPAIEKKREHPNPVSYGSEAVFPARHTAKVLPCLIPTPHLSIAAEFDISPEEREGTRADFILLPLQSYLEGVE